MPQSGERVAASAARILNAGGPPRWRISGRMSGVLQKRLPRKYSAMSDRVSSSKYSVSSSLKLRQVKYVYDWLKPALARAFIILGRVNASERKITSGWPSWTSRISHSQNSSGLVCGLSTRKMRTPSSTQNSTTRQISSQSDSHASHEKLTG